MLDMNIVSRFFILKILVSLILLAIVSCGPVLALDRIEIMGWWGPDSKTGQQAFDDMAKAGFTTTFVGGNLEEMGKGFDMCQKAGIRGLLYVDGDEYADIPAVLEKIENLTKAYHKHPALMGYLTRDEPVNYEQVLAVGLAAARIRAIDTKHPIFTNLVPGPGLWEPYEQNIEKYIAIAKPDMLSYDRYVLLPNSTVKDTYFLNMEIIRRQAIKHNIPFMNIFLSTPHGPYRDPSEADLRWQINTSLAYGAKALCYFTYMTPPANNPSYVGWGPAIVYYDGKHTPRYEIVSRINAEVNKLSPTLIKLKSTAVVHVPAIPGVATDTLTDKSITAISGGEFLIGFLDSLKGEKYAMVVNNDPTVSSQAKLEFASGTKADWCDPNTGKWIKAELQGSAWTVALGAGDARLLKFGN